VFLKEYLSYGIVYFWSKEYDSLSLNEVVARRLRVSYIDSLFQGVKDYPLRTHSL
jgi:hypothetical protein